MSGWLFRRGEEPSAGELSALSRQFAEGSLIWVDLTSYSVDDLNKVSDLLQIPPTARLAILSPWQTPHFEVYGTCALATLLIAWVDPSALEVRTSKLDVLVGKNFVLTAHKFPLPFLDRVLVRAKMVHGSLQISSSYLFYLILDALLQYYEILTDHIEDEIEQMFEQVLRASSTACLEILLRLKRYVLALVRDADHHRSVFAAFTRPGSPLVSSGEDESNFKDLQVHLSYVLDRLTVARESVSSAFAIYMSYVSHLSAVALRVLTGVSVLLLPASLLVALFGVFFQYLAIPQPQGLVAMVGTMGLLTATIFILLRRHGWA